jgi:hypothetical protein
VTEYWYAAELRLNLLTKRTDPRHGVQTVRVTELQRQEPDAALFAIGDDYKVVNEAGPTQVAQGPGATDERASTEKAATSAAGASGGAMAGIARPGMAGVTVPACVYCPNPSFTDEARAAKFNGSVVLQVVVTADGRAENKKSRLRPRAKRHRYSAKVAIPPCQRPRRQPRRHGSSDRTFRIK